MSVVDTHNKQAVDTIIKAGHVIPVVPRGLVLDEHAVAISGGRIAAILPNGEADALEAGEVIDLPGHVLAPGFINAHGHSAMSLLRGFADDLALTPWLENHIWPAEARHVSPEFVRDGTDLAIAEMLRSGTTCFADMFYFPNVIADRVQHVIQSCFAGRRIVIFSGGAAKGHDGVIEEIRSIAQGGGFGSIIGRNSFQRAKTDAVELLHEVMDIYRDAG